MARHRGDLSDKRPGEPGNELDGAVGRFRIKLSEELVDRNGARFYRVLKGFMVQFGLSGDPPVSSERHSKTIQDEPVKASNPPGHITCATPGACTSGP